MQGLGPKGVVLWSPGCCYGAQSPKPFFMLSSDKIIILAKRRSGVLKSPFLFLEPGTLKDTAYAM